MLLADIDADLKNQALGLLARREHSRRELADKLRRKTDNPEQLETLLHQLQQQGLQSDERFAESFIRARFARGQGPIRIQQELRQKGVPAETVTEAMESQQLDWFEAAKNTRDRRFGLAAPQDRKEYARQMRFLLYRGYSGDQAQEALQARPDDED